MVRKWQFILLEKMHVDGMTLFPIILIRNKKLLEDKEFINHEQIHLRQQLELMVIPFYLIYLTHYLINRIKYKSHDKAYRNICFEREAYANANNLTYLKNRKFMRWIVYLN